MISVFIVASVPALRAGLRSMLDGHDVQVIGEAGSLSGLDLSPTVDVLVLMTDRWQDDLDRLEPIDDRPGVVLLWDDPSPMAQLRAAPLRGWALLPPESAAPRLHAAVSAVAEGLIVLPQSFGEALGSASAALHVAASEVLQEPLTAREQQVLELLAQGLSNKLIARQLHISEHTVKFHVSSTYAKLGTSNRTEAVSHAARRGLITL